MHKSEGQLSGAFNFSQMYVVEKLIICFDVGGNEADDFVSPS